MSLEETKQIANQIEGWLSEDEGEFLYKSAKKCIGRGVIVEIGPWKGKSTVYLANGSKASNKVKIYTIDPYVEEYGGKLAFEEFKKNIKTANVEDVIEPLVKTSEEANKDWRKPIEFLWIDGDHSFPMVKLDFDLWSPYLIKGGTIAFHDAVSGGPKKVVCDFVLKSDKFGNAGLIDTIFYAQRLDNLSLKDKSRNRAMIILLNIYEVFRGIPLPKSLRKLIKGIVAKIV